MLVASENRFYLSNTRTRQENTAYEIHPQYPTSILPTGVLLIAGCKTYYGIGEWTMNKGMAEIPMHDYMSMAKELNPVHYLHILQEEADTPFFCMG